MGDARRLLRENKSGCDYRNRGRRSRRIGRPDHDGRPKFTTREKLSGWYALVTFINTVRITRVFLVIIYDPAESRTRTVTK